MLRYLLATALAVGFATPAFAECSQEIDEVRSAVEGSDLSDEQRDQVATVLDGARQQDEAGDAEGCMATVEQVRVALGLDH